MNILITGSNGQLGSELKALIQHCPTEMPLGAKFNTAPSGNALGVQHYNFYFTDKSELDITNQNAVEQYCIQNNIKIIINCAAYTAVDKAEEDKANADAINHLAVKYLAQIAKEKDIKLIHISTDYVFDGTNYKPYTESDATNPKSVYGSTKLLGEEAIMDINPSGAMIIRTSWVYSSFGNNFVKTMLRLGRERNELGVIFDQVSTPTYARDLAKAILTITQNLTLNTQNSVMVYHYSNEGVASWYDFARAIFEMSGIECSVNPIETKEYPTPATRPHYSLLNKEKIKNEFGIEIPYWKESLLDCINKILNDEFCTPRAFPDGAVMSEKNITLDKSFDFAIRIVRLYKYLCENKKEYIISKQLLRCGTSIGANINEASAAQSKKDFIAKMSIASKEARETKYWIDLLIATDYLSDEDKHTKSLVSDIEELIKLLTSIVKTSQQGLANNAK